MATKRRTRRTLPAIRARAVVLDEQSRAALAALDLTEAIEGAAGIDVEALFARVGRGKLRPVRACVAVYMANERVLEHPVGSLLVGRGPQRRGGALLRLSCPRPDSCPADGAQPFRLGSTSALRLPGPQRPAGLLPSQAHHAAVGPRNKRFALTLVGSGNLTLGGMRNNDELGFVVCRELDGRADRLRDWVGRPRRHPAAERGRGHGRHRRSSTCHPMPWYSESSRAASILRTERLPARLPARRRGGVGGRLPEPAPADAKIAGTARCDARPPARDREDAHRTHRCHAALHPRTGSRYVRACGSPRSPARAAGVRGGTAIFPRNGPRERRGGSLLPGRENGARGAWQPLSGTWTCPTPAETLDRRGRRSHRHARPLRVRRQGQARAPCSIGRPTWRRGPTWSSPTKRTTRSRTPGAKC